MDRDKEFISFVNQINLFLMSNQVCITLSRYTIFTFKALWHHVIYLHLKSGVWKCTHGSLTKSNLVLQAIQEIKFLIIHEITWTCVEIFKLFEFKWKKKLLDHVQHLFWTSSLHAVLIKLNDCMKVKHVFLKVSLILKRICCCTKIWQNVSHSFTASTSENWI